MKKHARKRSINAVPSSVLYVYKERTKLKTYYLQDIVREGRRAQYCARWAPKVIFGA